MKQLLYKILFVDPSVLFPEDVETRLVALLTGYYRTLANRIGMPVKDEKLKQWFDRYPQENFSSISHFVEFAAFIQSDDPQAFFASLSGDDYKDEYSLQAASQCWQEFGAMLPECIGNERHNFLASMKDMHARHTYGHMVGGMRKSMIVPVQSQRAVSQAILNISEGITAQGTNGTSYVMEVETYDPYEIINIFRGFFDEEDFDDLDVSNTQDGIINNSLFLTEGNINEAWRDAGIRQIVIGAPPEVKSENTDGNILFVNNLGQAVLLMGQGHQTEEHSPYTGRGEPDAAVRTTRKLVIH